jgi:hypothetical protein
MRENSGHIVFAKPDSKQEKLRTESESPSPRILDQLLSSAQRALYIKATVHAAPMPINEAMENDWVAFQKNRY